VGLEASLLVAAAAAGALYVVTPGPAFVALLGLCAARGRQAGAFFLGGHMAGDLVWSSLALVALVGARIIDPRIFDALGLACGLYLIHLGWQALRARRMRDEIASPFDRPLRHGLVFGLTNPKGYPVALGMFAALLGPHAAQLGLAIAPWLLAAAMIGVVLGAIMLVAFAGMAFVRRFYARHDLAVTRAAGALFVAFGVSAIATALPGLWPGA
jgi:threonine/homoserine/homoserine lactone efflux protein